MPSRLAQILIRETTLPPRESPLRELTYKNINGDNARHASIHWI